MTTAFNPYGGFRDTPAGTLVGLLADWAKGIFDTITPAVGLNEQAINEIVTGSAVIVNGQTSVTVADVGISGSHDNGCVLVSFGEDPGAAATVWGAVASDDLTITVDTNPGKDLTVYYLIRPIA
jgi:hypothetical protein